MKLGLVTDCLGYLSFDDMVKTAAELGYQQLELATGNWSQAPHVDLDNWLTSTATRQSVQETLAEHHIEICAFNCSGNPLAPNEEGRQHNIVTEKTFQLAELMGVKEIVMMSGLPGAAPGETVPNWITTCWPARNSEILEWQWNEVAIPYWKNLARLAEQHGIERIAVENHPAQLVYNPETFLKLREHLGDRIGMNFDPSHHFWMGGDPIRTARALGKAIYHVHAKDTRIERGVAEINGYYETKFFDRTPVRSWNYVALGHGHDVSWWKEFFAVLKMSGFTGNVTLENEDLTMDSYTALVKATNVLKEALPARF